MSSESDKFADMARRIEHNVGTSKFGGAFVIVPPPNGGEAMEVIVLDQSQDAVRFWTTLDFAIKSQLDKMREQERVAQGFGGRR